MPEGVPLTNSRRRRDSLPEEVNDTKVSFVRYRNVGFRLSVEILGTTIIIVWS